jgi:hypothetical protein
MPHPTRVAQRLLRLIEGLAGVEHGKFAVQPRARYRLRRHSQCRHDPGVWAARS